VEAVGEEAADDGAVDVGAVEVGAVEAGALDVGALDLGGFEVGSEDGDAVLGVGVGDSAASDERVGLGGKAVRDGNRLPVREPVGEGTATELPPPPHAVSTRASSRPSTETSLRMRAPSSAVTTAVCSAPSSQGGRRGKHPGHRAADPWQRAVVTGQSSDWIPASS
jgi:hypothetical protein